MGGSPRATAFGGTGSSVAEKRLYGDLVWRRVLGGRGTAVVCGDSLTLGSAPGTRGGTGKVAKEENIMSGPASLAEIPSHWGLLLKLERVRDSGRKRQQLGG